MTGVTYPDQATQAYTYDSVGNRLTKVEGTDIVSYATPRPRAG